MVGSSRYNWRVFAGTIVATSLFLPVLPAHADPGDRDESRIVAPHTVYKGLSYGDWAAAWWQYMFSVPVGQNPLVDATGANAHTVVSASDPYSQNGPVAFLGGIFGGGGAVTRTITVPKGTSLFFPMWNYISDNTGFSDPGNEPTHHTASVLASHAAHGASLVTGVYASIDGAPVRDIQDYLAVSPAFEYVPPATTDAGYTGPWRGDGAIYTYDTVANGVLWSLFDSTPFVYVGPAVTEGYWLMLRPLSPGKHVIKFGANFFGAMDVTYKITVSP